VLCEPGFDMLLDLYVARCSDADVSVSSLGLAGQVPATTALRRIEELQRLGLVVRQPDPLDRRRVFVRMSDRAFADIGRWLDQIG
jgi:DNA-binding MarR family transcriptional regulator